MWFDIVEIFSLKKFENWVYKNYLQSISKLKDEIISILREIERQLLCQNILENFNKRSDACRLKEVLWEILFLDKFHKWFFNYRMNSNYVFISFLKNAESSCLFFNCNMESINPSYSYYTRISAIRIPPYINKLSVLVSIYALYYDEIFYVYIAAIWLILSVTKFVPHENDY